MGFKKFIILISSLGISIILYFLFTASQLNAQPATLELHRIWEVDIDGGITALRLADLDGDGTNEIFVGLWDGDSGYIEVFSGFNRIFLQRSEKIPGHKVIDLDVGDIDGDQNLEVVVGADTTHNNGYNSLICVLDANELVLVWQERLRGKVKSIETEDINQDDTAEVFIGVYYHTYYHEEGWGYSYTAISDKGALYHFNGKDTVITLMDTSRTYWKLVPGDVDQDSYNEIVCGTSLGSYQYYYHHGSDPWSVTVSWTDLYLLQQDGSLSNLCTLYDYVTYDAWYLAFCPAVVSMVIGDCDADDNLEIVSYLNSGILSMTDAISGIIEYSTTYGDDVVALALFDVDAQLPDEILIAHSSGFIQALDGATFDTVAISDPLPPISFFVFGDVTGDAMPEICISDGDSLFLYGFGPTAIEEDNEEIIDSKFIVHQSYPNPFNPRTTIQYYLPQGSNVELSIFNIKGQRVKTLVDDFQPVGFESVTWDGTDKNGTDVASGIYFYRVKTDFSEETRKMVLMK